MEAVQRRIIRRAFALTVKGRPLLVAFSTALDEEHLSDEDAERMRRAMEQWLRENAIAQATGSWAIPQSIVEKLEE